MHSLLKKEFSLSMHPTMPIFLALSVLLIIPDYPYYVTFFYTSLGIFFTCLSGRENNDIIFTLSMPVRKNDIVTARILFSVIFQLLQIASAIPFAVIRQSMPLPGNSVGMDANIAFFGLAFIMLGIFNLLFFTSYYKNPSKVGKAFVNASVAIFVYMFTAEALSHTLPFFMALDTPDPQNILYKIYVLITGIAVYAALTFAALRISQKSFDNIDI